MTRRQILIGGAAVLALLAGAWQLLPRGGALAAKGELYEDDRVLGEADAPVTIIEYASLTCPHCATFHNDVLPQVREEWIDTGRARFVLRHFPLNQLDVRAALLANCLEGKEHFAMVDALFKDQQRWAGADDPMAALSGIARLAGIDQERFEACTSDEAEIDKILARRQDGEATYDVRSTPTLIVNGEKVDGAHSYEEFAKVLEKAAGSS